MKVTFVFSRFLHISRMRFHIQPEEFRQRVANIVSSNDLDGDGKLQWEEFVALMRKNV